MRNLLPEACLAGLVFLAETRLHKFPLLPPGVRKQPQPILTGDPPVDELAESRRAITELLYFLPYSCAVWLGRAALRGSLGKQTASPNERKLRENVIKRVRMWKEVEPFYSDQTSGLPKHPMRAGTKNPID